MMRTFVLTVTVNPAIDKVIKTRRFEIGQDNRVHFVFRSAGGKGINVSRALSHLKVPTRAIGILAGPAGAYIRAVLEAENIKEDFLQIPGESRTSMTVISPATKQPTRILEPGPLLQSYHRRIFQKKYMRLAKNARWVIISGRNALGAPDDFYRQLIRRAKQMKKRVILDTSGRPLKWGLQARPYMIKPNRQEAEELIGQPLASPRQWRRALEILLDKGVEVVLISLGRAGAVASNGEEYWHVQPPAIRIVNSVGCGDAMIAGYVYARQQGADFLEAVKLAVAAGTVNALHIQPGYLKRRPVLQMARLLTIKSL